MRINLKNETQAFLIDGFFATVAIASGTALYNGNGYRPVLLGFGGIAALTVLSRRWPWRSSSRMPRWDRAFSTFQSLTPSQGGGWTMGWHDRREPEPEEFVFSGLDLPTPIPESTFRRFIGIAWRRQTKSVNDTKYAMSWTGNGYHRIKTNWILSKNHFTDARYVRPRFPKDEYLGCLLILGWTRLLVGKRGQGTSGRLYGDVTHWSRHDYCRTAKERWIRLGQRPTMKLFSPPIPHR